ncbi:MAG: hypothetical protein QOF01_893 [Thermomicrobiales bacterium]|jgi:L-asparaginase II|nr:hypothetical protein [Thermomicrobiales bacterium]
MVFAPSWHDAAWQSLDDARAAVDHGVTEVTTLLTEVTRGARTESVHLGVAVAVDVTGAVVAAAGDPEHVAYFRSSAKPFQAVPCVESGAADAYGFNQAELAIGCASHNATPQHQHLVAGMLEKVGLGEEHLRCGFAPPADEQEKARITLGLVPRSQIQCECSGEHAAMLAACRRQGFPLDSYVEADHPLQRRVRQIIAAVVRMNEDDIVLAVDGCSLPTFGAPVRAFATAYATLAAPERAPAGAGRELAPVLERLRAAIVAHPEQISGDGVLDTDLMRYSGGRIVAKLGAEGLLCMAVPERALGIAIKAIDGSPRALGPAAIAALDQFQLLEPAALAELRKRHSAPVSNFQGQPVGEMRPALRFAH